MSNAMEMEQEFESKTLTLYEQAYLVRVVDQGTYETAGDMASTLKGLEKQITEYFKPLKESAYLAHKTITQREAKELSPVKEALDLLRGSMNAYLREQERLRLEAQRQAEEEARRQAAEERKGLLAEAEQALDSGDTVAAEELLDMEADVYTAPVIVAPVVPQTVKVGDTTLSQARDLQVEVVDPRVFLKALVERNVPPTMIEVKIAPLKAWVKANAHENFPGLRISSGPSVRIR